ncbi:hypothetical protein BDO18943_05273 [Burkholderia dolosa]|nr:hypothetical protein BDO18943_05273 [Burkholderia dolosa]
MFCDRIHAPTYAFVHGSNRLCCVMPSRASVGSHVLLICISPISIVPFAFVLTAFGFIPDSTCAIPRSRLTLTCWNAAASSRQSARAAPCSASDIAIVEAIVSVSRRSVRAV